VITWHTIFLIGSRLNTAFVIKTVVFLKSHESRFPLKSLELKSLDEKVFDAKIVKEYMLDLLFYNFL